MVKKAESITSEGGKPGSPENPLEPPAGMLAPVDGNADVGQARGKAKAINVVLSAPQFGIKKTFKGDPATVKLVSFVNAYNNKLEADYNRVGTGPEPKFITTMPKGEVGYKIKGKRFDKKWQIKATPIVPKHENNFINLLIQQYGKQVAAVAEKFVQSELNSSSSQTPPMCQTMINNKYYHCNVINWSQIIGSF